MHLQVFFKTCILFLELLMNLFSKSDSYPVVNIGKFSSQLYVTTQLRKAISSRRLFQRLNSSRVVLRTNTCRVENLIMHLRRVIRANHNESLVKLSEVHSIFIVSKREVLVTPEVRDYATPVVCKNSLTDFSSVSNPTLVVSKCSNVIPCKFKAVKFMIE